MTVSHWMRTSGSPKFTADVVVVGGGIAGVSVALTLERLGKRVILIEQRTPGYGASGRNAGFLMRGAARSYSAGIDELGRERTAALWRLTEENLALLRSEGVDHLDSYRKVPSCILAFRDDEADELHASAQAMEHDGFDAPLLTSGTDTVWNVAKPKLGLVNPNDATINPIDLVRLLASKLESTRVFTGCRVQTIDSTSNGVRVEADGMSFEADRVMVCTNAWLRELVPTMAGAVEPNRGQMLAFRPESPITMDHAYYANFGSEYFRMASDGIAVMGGARIHAEADERTDQDAVNDVVQAKLESFVRSWVTDRYEVVARWSGIMGFSPKGLPIVGPAPETDDRVWVCAGFTGHGMSMGHATSVAAARWIADEAEPGPAIERTSALDTSTPSAAPEGAARG